MQPQAPAFCAALALRASVYPVLLLPHEHGILQCHPAPQCQGSVVPSWEPWFLNKEPLALVFQGGPQSWGAALGKVCSV